MKRLLLAALLTLAAADLAALSADDQQLIDEVVSALQQQGIPEPNDAQVHQALLGLVEYLTGQDRPADAAAIAELAQRHAAERFGADHSQTEAAMVLVE